MKMIQNNNLQPSSNQTKKEWVDEFKKVTNSYKQDEKNLVHSYFTEDYHMNKIFLSLKQEEELEKKLINDTLKNMKLSVNEIDMIFKGTHKAYCHNNELRQKIQKMEDLINKNRLDLSNKFQNLLNEEDQLQSEINDFEMKLQYELNINQINNDPITRNNESVELTNNLFKKQVNNNNFNIEFDEYNLNMKDELNFKKNLTFDSYLYFIFNESNKTDILITEDDLNHLVNKFTQLNAIKEKTNIIDSLIEKKFQGQNLGWKPKDHHEFLKLRTANNNKINTFEFLMDLENALPFIQKNELKAHIKSFNQYLKLTDFKRIFLTKYKTMKKEAEDLERKAILEKLEQEKNIIMQEKKKNEVILANDDEEKRKKLEEWKIEKQNKAIQEKEEKQRKEQIEKQKQKNKFIGIVESNKTLVEEFKKKKEVETERLRNSSKGLLKVEINEIDLERVKERNQALEEKRKLLVKSKSINMVKTSENYVKYKLKNMEKYADIETKFDKPSELEERKKRKKHDYVNNKDGDTMAGNVLGKMSRAIPVWRQGL